jgi:hypothetical protein
METGGVNDDKFENLGTYILVQGISFESLPQFVS